MRIDFSIAGETLISRELLRFGDRAHDARPAFSAIADDIFRIQLAQFNSQGGRGPSGKWAPLAQSTVEAKARANLDPRILHATLALRNALTRRGADHQVLHVTDSFLVLGADLEYLAFHQHGTSRMPKRRVFDFTKVDKRSIPKVLQRFIMTGKV